MFALYGNKMSTLKSYVIGFTTVGIGLIAGYLMPHPSTRTNIEIRATPDGSSIETIRDNNWKFILTKDSQLLTGINPGNMDGRESPQSDFSYTICPLNLDIPYTATLRQMQQKAWISLVDCLKNKD